MTHARPAVLPAQLHIQGSVPCIRHQELYGSSGSKSQDGCLVWMVSCYTLNRGDLIPGMIETIMIIPARAA